MGIFSRISAIFESRANQVADHLEDPRASLDYSLVKLEESRAQIIRSLIDVAAAKSRLQNQRDQYSAYILKTQDQAQAAVNSGRDDLARLALARKQEAESRRVQLDAHLASMDQQVEALKQSQANLDQKIAYFRSRKEELKAIYTSSKAQLQVHETLSGISSDLSDVGNTIRRTEARIREMQSRAEAIQGLVADGVLIEVLSPETDDIDRELSRMDRSHQIEVELTRLKSGEDNVARLMEKNEQDASSGSHEHPTVDAQDGAGDKAGFVGGQE